MAIGTSAGVIVLRGGGDVLLGHATGTRHWDIFKGMPDPAEAWIDAALRELAEEAGIRLETTALTELGPFTYRADKALRLFATRIEGLDASACVCTSFFESPSGRSLPEMDRHAWVPFADVPRHCARNMSRVLTQELSLYELAARLEPAAYHLQR